MNLEEFRKRYRYNTDTDLLGRGGFSKVYKAYDQQEKRWVALKFYQSHIGEKYGVIAELQKMLHINHPNLVRYYDAQSIASPSIYDEDATIQIGVLEYVNAGDLNQFMQSFPDMESIKKVVEGILKGLEQLHQQGIIHRDIKPQNILLHKEQGIYTPKITDFGLAKKVSNHNQSSKLLGTMEYMAPEQFNASKYGINGKLGTNVDLWSLGVILYEIFTGEFPFGSRDDGQTHEEVMFAIMRNEIGDGLHDILQPYQDIIRLCLVKNANERVQEERILLDLLAGKKSVKHPIGKQQAIEATLSLTPSQKRGVFIGNLLLSPLFGIILFFWWYRKSPQKAQQALNLAWWALAIWLVLLIVIVSILIFVEYATEV